MSTILDRFLRLAPLILKSCQEKFSIDPFSKGSSWVVAYVSIRRVNPPSPAVACERYRSTAKSPYGRRSAKGELKNNPVDCFSRGKSLQERDFPSGSASLSSLRALACAIAIYKFALTQQRKLHILHGVPEWNAERKLRSSQRRGSAIRSKITRSKRLDEHFEKSVQSCKKQFLASCLL